MRSCEAAVGVALGTALVWLSGSAFSLGSLPTAQQLGLRSGFQPPAAQIAGTDGQFAGSSSGLSGVASPGCALGVASLIAMCTKARWARKHRQRWRKAVNSENRGIRGYRGDRRPPLLGSEKPPNEGKRMYHYYCNKMYKVIRFADSETQPASQLTKGT
mmetsp:Transcript_105745/g.252238  ORF Transcript_105745/g.252238 Transcript_105745/m.252238 type:complete len:159 (-) Transcript_105745:66-542(-)